MKKNPNVSFILASRDNGGEESPYGTTLGVGGVGGSSSGVATSSSSAAASSSAATAAALMAGPLYASHSNPDLSSICYEDARADFPEHVLKVCAVLLIFFPGLFMDLSLIFHSLLVPICFYFLNPQWFQLSLFFLIVIGSFCVVMKSEMFFPTLLGFYWVLPSFFID